MKTCSVDGCTGRYEGLGYCRVHYRRFKKHGTTDLAVHQAQPCSGKFACHHCDNPGCVNAAHLYEGDAQTNVDDMWRRDRANPKGLREKGWRPSVPVRGYSE